MPDMTDPRAETLDAPSMAQTAVEGRLLLSYYAHIDLDTLSPERDVAFVYRPATRYWGLCDAGRALREQLEYALHLVNQHVNDPAARTKDRRALLEIAQFGLQGRAANPQEGLAKLEAFKTRLDSRLKKARDGFAKRTNRASLWVLAISALAATVIGLWGKWSAEGLAAASALLMTAPLDLAVDASGNPAPIDINAAMTTLFVFFYGGVGLALGEIFTAMRESAQPRFEQFQSNPRFRFSPLRRWVFIFAAWAILLYLVSHDWIVFGIGDASVNGVMDAPLTAPLLGLVTTICFNMITEAISTRAERQMLRNKPAG
ncbi:MAG: hypothetical protein AAFR17_03805 [Pseudomonadota bacterium]